MYLKAYELERAAVIYRKSITYRTQINIRSAVFFVKRYFCAERCFGKAFTKKIIILHPHCQDTENVRCSGAAINLCLDFSKEPLRRFERNQSETRYTLC